MIKVLFSNAALSKSAKKNGSSHLKRRPWPLNTLRHISCGKNLATFVSKHFSLKCTPTESFDRRGLFMTSSIYIYKKRICRSKKNQVRTLCQWKLLNHVLETINYQSFKKICRKALSIRILRGIFCCNISNGKIF